MQGSQGLFRPASTVTYAEMVQSLTAAVEEEGLITGLIVRTRDAEGVLAEGAARQVNDGKFRVETVTASEEGYTVALSGLEAAGVVETVLAQVPCRETGEVLAHGQNA